MRFFLLMALLFSAFPTLHAEDDDTPEIQRNLVGLKLGDKLKKVQALCPPAAEWPFTEVSDGVRRYRVDRAVAKSLPPSVEVLFLGLKKGRLVEIQAVYNEEKSRAKSVDKLAGDYALYYGEARRAGEKFWWSDKKTVLRIFSAEIPVAKSAAKAVVLRTAVQIFDARIVSRGE